MLVSDLSAALDQDEPTALVALDIGRAFDRVWHKALILKLNTAGKDGALLPLLGDCLRDRLLQVTVSGPESDERPITAVFPRGVVSVPCYGIFI